MLEGVTPGADAAVAGEIAAAAVGDLPHAKDVTNNPMETAPATIDQEIRKGICSIAQKNLRAMLKPRYQEWLLTPPRAI